MDTKFPDLVDDILNFDIMNNDHLEILNPIHNFDGGRFVNQNQYQNYVNEYFLTIPMENEIVSDLNLPKKIEKDQDKYETYTTGSVPSPTGIIPSQDEFGSFDFEVMNDQKLNYSKTLKKVFIDINKVLLLNFKYDYENIGRHIPLFVRAMPMYSGADHLKQPVDRCLLHLSPIDMLNKGFNNLEHIIRCDNENTSYHVDQHSKRKSVVSLLSRPEHGSNSSRLAYRFVCKTSCFGGMARRPIIVIFTLESDNGQVFGRRVLHVKICACPKRDKEREERDVHGTYLKKNKRCISQENHHHNDFCPPRKIYKLVSKVVSSSSTESDSENTFTWTVSYTTKKKKIYKKTLEGVYNTFVGVESLYKMNDAVSIIEYLNARIKNVE